MAISIHINRASLPMAYVLMLLMFSAGAQAEAQTSRLQLIKATCYTCHSNTGASPIPPLDGLDRAQMSRLLRAYKTGENPAPVMHPIASALTDNEIEQISSMFSGSGE